MRVHAHRFSASQEDRFMRSLAPICLAFMLSVTAFAVSTGTASAQHARYCLQGKHYGHPGNCAFQTRAQCMASASGTGSSCGINPRYAYARQRGTMHRHNMRSY